MVYISIRKIISIYSVGKWVNVKMGIWEKAYFIDKMITAKILKNIMATSPLTTKSFLQHMSNVKQYGYKNKFPEWEDRKMGILFLL